MKDNRSEKQENTKETVKAEKKPMSPEKKRLAVILSVAAAAVVIALIPIIIFIVSSLNDEDGHGVPEEYLDGSYVLETRGAFVMYTFSGNKLTYTYVGPDGDISVDENGNIISDPSETVTVDYTFELVRVGDNRHSIRMTKSDGEVEVRPFTFGKENPTYFRCENEACYLNDSNLVKGRDEDPRKDGSEYCTSHPESKIYEETVDRLFISFDDFETDVPEFYYKK